MADASGVDLDQFKLWYSQAGTPRADRAGELRRGGAQLHARRSKRSCPPTPGQPDKQPFHILLSLGLIGPDGRDRPLRLADGRTLDRGILTLTKAEESFVFAGLDAPPVLSLNRGFSAPVKIHATVRDRDLELLAAHDSDPFNRWQAAQTLATAILVANVAAQRTAMEPMQALRRRADPGAPHRASTEPAPGSPLSSAQTMALLSEKAISPGKSAVTSIPTPIHAARRALRTEVGRDPRSPAWRDLRPNERARTVQPRTPRAPGAAPCKNVCPDLHGGRATGRRGSARARSNIATPTT